MMGDINLLPPVPFWTRNKAHAALVLAFLFLLLAALCLFLAMNINHRVSAAEQKAISLQQKINAVNDRKPDMRVQGLEDLKDSLDALSGQRINYLSRLDLVYNLLPAGAYVSDFDNNQPQSIKLSAGFTSLDQVARYTASLKANPAVQYVEIKNISLAQVSNGTAGVASSVSEILNVLQAGNNDQAIRQEPPPAASVFASMVIDLKPDAGQK